MRTLFFVTLALSTSACLFSPTPKDGALACSATGPACPDGYSCAADAHCWRVGHEPVGGNGDVDGGVVDADGGVDAPDLAPAMSCAHDGDCPTPSSPCQQAACTDGSCGARPLPPGDLPASAQKAGDCSKLACDGNGQVETLVDSSDLPSDGHECTTDSCDGSTPRFDPKPPGTTCSTGVCNGKGACGACTPGDKRCDASNTIPQQCDANGNWVNGTKCQYVCTAGACAGSCTPGDTSQCNGTQPLQCNNSGQWVANGSACPGGCVGGKCTACQPGAKACSNASTPEHCSTAGQWVADAACPSTQTCINNGVCGGQCGPGQRQCNASQPQVCDGNGNWANYGGQCAICEAPGQCHSFSLGGDEQGVDAGGGGGGSYFGLDSCDWGSGEIAIGFQASTGSWMDGIALICGLLHSDGSVTNSRQLGWHGGTGGQLTTVQCSPGMVLVGFDGSAGNYVNTLRGRCSWPAGVHLGDTGYAATITAGGNAGPNGIAAQCPAGYATTGIAGNAGGALDHLTFTCHPIQ